MEYSLRGKKPTMMLVLGCLAFAFPLLGYVLNGSYARFVQDDYCYAAMLGRMPFWQGQWHAYFNISAFSGNRYSLTFLMGLSEFFGIRALQVLPGLAIAAWLWGLVPLWRRTARLIGYEMHWLVSLLISEGLVYLTLSQAPNLPQILYWRPGMLPYLAPLITGTFLAALILKQMMVPHTHTLIYIQLGCLAFLAAGFSETAAALQAGMLGLALLASWIALRRGSQMARKAFYALWAAMLGTLLGMVVLIVSPINAIRQEQLFPEPAGIGQIILISVQSTVSFIKYVLYRLTVPTFFSLAFSFTLGNVVSQHMTKEKPHSFYMLILILLSVPLIAFLLVACVAAPSAYAESTYPEQRALLGASLVSVLAAAAIGGVVAGIIRQLSEKMRYPWLNLGLIIFQAQLLLFMLFLVLPGSTDLPAYPDIRAYGKTHLAFSLVFLFAAGILSWILSREVQKNNKEKLALSLLLILLCVYPLYTGRSIYADTAQYQQRAQDWDNRDRMIREAEEEGLREIEVPALDSFHGVADLQENPQNWINNCAEWYYGMEAISAVEQ